MADAMPLLRLGVSGAFIAFFRFGAIMLATRLDKLGVAAVLRETSTEFAGLIGCLVLGKKVGLVRFSLLALIAAGAVVVKLAG